MAEEKVLVLEKTNVTSAVWFLSLMATAIILPSFIHNQFITGPIVNATLFLATFFIGARAAMLIGLVPSVVALSSGLLPLALAPVVPFIMISNALLILSFDGLRKFNNILAAFTACIVKYLFLYGSCYLISNIIIQKTVATKAIIMMMSWSQLVTALVGAVIAFTVLRILKKV